MKYFTIISRILLGLVFIFSGFVKGVDPLGSQFKFTDYFLAFGMDWAIPTALFFAFLLSAGEFIIGIALLFNLKMKFTAWALLFFMIFFTVLTFILAITNPVSDCGCFGDAMILTNWETFFKNLVLIVPAIIVFFNRHKFPSYLPETGQWILAGIFSFFILGISFYSYQNLPLLDFRPYKIGTHIPDGMIIPENAPRDQYHTTVVYEKNEVKQEFEMNLLPDTSWKWVETKNELIKEGYKPPIHDFTISSTLGEDITDLVLNDEGYYFLFISSSLDKASTSHIKQVNFMSRMAEMNGHKFIGLTSSGINAINNFKTQNNVSFTFYSTDETTLKTMIRANPGIMLLHKGTVVAIWNANHLPNPDRLMRNIESYLFKKQVELTNQWMLIALASFGFLLASLYFFTQRKNNQ